MQGKRKNILNEINSEGDSKTQMSDGSSKTSNTRSSKTSNIFQKTNRLPLANEQGKKDEFDEVLEYEQIKHSEQKQQNEKVLFYEICFNMKTKMFPKNHLARYANISLLHQHALK